MSTSGRPSIRLDGRADQGLWTSRLFDSGSDSRRKGCRNTPARLGQWPDLRQVPRESSLRQYWRCLGKHNAIAEQLIDAACDLADALDVKYLECRHESPVVHQRFNFARCDKVHMRLALPATDDQLMASFKSKLRSQIRKSDEYELEVDFGGERLLGGFYSVFATNMRDLGTPVFSRRLFSQILDHFCGDAEICVVSKRGKPIAGALLVHGGGVTEVPSASSLRAFNRTNANMLMYRCLLRRAIEKGSQTFDFGRSSEQSGTYRFKSQWGAKPHAATWQYYVRKGDPNDMRPDAGGKKRLVKMWQKLPVWFAGLIGPTIVRGIP